MSESQRRFSSGERLIRGEDHAVFYLLVFRLVASVSCKRPTSSRQTAPSRPVGAGPTPALWPSYQKRKGMKSSGTKAAALSCLCWEMEISDAISLPPLCTLFSPLLLLLKFALGSVDPTQMHSFFPSTTAATSTSHLCTPADVQTFVLTRRKQGRVA